MARARRPDLDRRSAPSRAAEGADLPQSADAEISVLGSMILNNDTVDVVVPILGADDFASAAHRKIFEAILAVHEQQRAVDLITLPDELKRRADLETVGGLTYLSSLAEAVPAPGNVEHYAQIVREKSVQRNLLIAAREISDSVARGDSRSRELLDEAEAKIFHIAEVGAQTNVTPFKDVLKSAFEMIDRGREGMVSGLGTGFADLDEYTSGLQSGELIIVAGRPSMGKTSFALNIVQHVGVQLGLPVVIFSLEMSKEQLARNMLCSHLKLDSQRLRRGRLTSEEREQLPIHVGALMEAPIFIDDSAALNTFEIRAKVRRLKRSKGLRLAVIDYLQLMQGSEHIDSREQQIAAISRSLKGLAREMQIPVIAVAQLNRQAEQRDDHRPRMADLRESGSLEQDADVVLLLHRPAYYMDSQSEDTTAELIIAKQRNGPTGKVNLAFLRQFLRFESSTEGAREFG
jgi:replicative DNA helicase